MIKAIIGIGVALVWITFFALAKANKRPYTVCGRTRRGDSGALNLQSAAAGLDSRFEACACEAGTGKGC